MRAYIKSLFSVAGLKRIATAYIISYLGTFLSLSFLAIVFWTSVSSPAGVSSVLKHSGVQENLIYQLAEKSNLESINNSFLDSSSLKQAIDTAIDEQTKASISAEFSKSFHEWVAQSSGPFYFSYDLSTQAQKIRQLDNRINTNFLENGKLVVEYDSGESSIKLRPQRSYTYFWWATILGPIFFVILGVCLHFFYKSKLELLFKIKRMMYYSSIAILISIPFNNLYWHFLADRMSTYPKAGLAGALSVKPITSEVLLRMNMVAVLSFVVYLTIFLVIKKYLKAKNFTIVEERHKNDLWEFTVKTTKFYIKKLK